MIKNLRFLPGRADAVVSGWLARAIVSLPVWLLRRLGGAPPPEARDLHPEAWVLARLSRYAPDRQSDDKPVAEQRRLLALSVAPMTHRLRAAVQTTDVAIPGPAGTIPARLSVPAGVSAPAPLLVYFHGGGWVQGSVRTHEASCRRLAHLAGVRVLSVDYRLAPEHPWPAAVDDALAAYAYAVREAGALGADPERIAVGGDSAGGNLAAIVSLLARDDDALAPPAFQLLLYPVTDLSRKAVSITTFAEGFFLTERGMDWFAGKYVPADADRADLRLSPLVAPDLAGLPPAHVATCLTDPLRDEGEAYARRLREAGVAVSARRHPLLHGFFNTTALRSSREAVAEIAGVLRQGLHAG